MRQNEAHFTAFSTTTRASLYQNVSILDLLELRMTEVVSGDNWSCKTSSQIITTSILSPNLFTDRMPFLLPIHQCQIAEGKALKEKKLRQFKSY